MPQPGITEGEDGIRRLDDPVLQADAEEAFGQIGANEHFAIIPQMSLDGPRMTFVGRMGDHFSVAACIRHDWGGWKGSWKERGALGFKAVITF